MELDVISPAPAGEPWGRRLWITLAVVLIIAAALESYGISSWPMADDEVPSLVEMGLLDVPAQAFSVPASQIGRLPKALPVWYAAQRVALKWLPHTQLGFRIPSLIYAVLTSALAFLLAARWRGLRFAAALAIVVHGCQLFLLVAQVDRFYALPLLLLTITFVLIAAPSRGATMLVASTAVGALTILSHNITAGVFVLAFLAAVPAYWLGAVPRHIVVRTATVAALSLLLYGLYLRALMHGWSSTGNPTPVLVSYGAHAGVPTLALALLGGWLSVTRRTEQPLMLWWTILFAGSLAFVQVTSTFMSWNPRYFVFLMPPMWLLAAHAMTFVADRLPGRRLAAAWYGCVVLLLAPGVLSHFQDGSRHDYRAAAEAILAHVQPTEPVLSDDAETISYYLPAEVRQYLFVRTKVTQLPSSEFYLVCRMNAWTPQPQIAGRRVDVVAEIFKRRFDQFSHVLRVYRVASEQ